MSDKWFWIGFVGTMALLLLARVGAVAVRVWYLKGQGKYDD